MSIFSVKNVISLPRRQKRAIVVATDVVISLLSVAAAYFIRIDGLPEYYRNQWALFVFAPCVAIPTFLYYDCYRAVFRFVGGGTISKIARASFIYCLICAAIFTCYGVEGVPRSLGVLQPILFFMMIVSSRIVARELLRLGNIPVDAPNMKNALIYGAGLSGQRLAAGLNVKGGSIDIVGFIDDDERLHGHLIDNLKVYSSKNLTALIAKLDVDEIFLAIPSATRARRNEILEAARGSGAHISVLPDLTDLAQGRVTVNELRELSVEDLLGRDPVPPIVELFERRVLGKVVLVTGAGGSIGSELCRQILSIVPAKLVLVEASEYALYAIERELQSLSRDRGLETEITPVLANVTDATALDDLFSRHRPSTVYHAAAYKHVPLVERNEAAGVLNNTFGTMATALASERHGVSDFVLISTDKAVRPTSVMGTSKRLAEMVLQALAHRGSATCFSMVRFGNVLGSSGSVVPLFRSQIRAGGPITITHPDITRYFMTIPEAAQLVIQAGAMAQGGEVFVLDMGEPVRIVDLAQKMIDLSGMTLRTDANPDGDIAIEITGLREGEKLYEELLIGNNPVPTQHRRIMMAMEPVVGWDELEESLAALRHMISNNEAVAIRALLVTLIPDFVDSRQSDKVLA